MTADRARSELPGLQAERTGLAWDRTALAFFANGVLLIIRHVGAAGTADLVVAVVALAGAGVAATAGFVRSRRITRPDTPVRPARGSVIACAVAVLVMGVAVFTLESIRLLTPE